MRAPVFIELLESRLMLAVDSPTVNLVDQGGDVGSYSSLALTSTQQERIAYYDATDGVLKYASWDGSAWSFQVVDSSGDVGQYASLKLYNDSPRIAYYDAANGDLKYASWNGAAWQIQTVDSSGDVGQYASLAIDSNGRPHIAYYDATNGNLKSAILTAGGTWSITTVDASGDMGRYASLALSSSNYDYIAYYDATDGYLKLAQRTAGYWYLTTLDTSADVGYGASIALNGADNSVSVSYYDATNGNLKLATLAASTVQAQTICSGGQFTSLALDSQGHPQIAFEDAARNRLQYACWDGHEWDASATMDLGTNIGQYVSLALDGGDNGRMAYYDPVQGFLKLARIPPDTEPPMAIASLPDVTQAAPLISINVSYLDNRAIDVSSLAGGNVRVEGPNGYMQIARFDHVDKNWDNTPRQAVYTITATGGDWSADNNGTYDVYLQPAQVFDTAGLAAPEGLLASFDVDIGSPSYPLDAKHPVTFLDGDGDKVTITMGGAGSGSVLLDTTGETFINSITLQDTDLTTKLTVKVAKGPHGDGLVQLKDLNDYAAAVGTIAAGQVDLRDSIYLGGGVGKLTLHDVLNNGTDHGLTVGSDGTLLKTTLAMNNVYDLNLASDLPVASVKVNRWIDSSGSADSLSAPWVGTLAVKGDFQSGLFLSAPPAVGPVIKSATIGGGVSSASWDLSGPVGKITIAGSLAGSKIRAAGSITSVTVGASISSDIQAGVSDLAVRHAAAAADFVTAATIGTFTIKGLKNATAGQTFFQDSNLSAQYLGKITIVNPDTTSDEDFGLWVKADLTPPPVKQLVLARPTGKVKSVPIVSSRTDQFVVEIL